MSQLLTARRKGIVIIMKKAFAMVLSILMVLTLAACSQSAPTEGTSGGTSSDTSSQGGGTDAAEPAKVDFPTKPITLICPYAAGGQSDMICRTVADQMGDILGQTITVVNTPGAGGSVGASQAAAEKNDGYTMFMCSAGNISVVPYCSEVSYTIDSFDMIGQATDTPFCLVVSNDFPASNVEEFIAYAKEHPGLNFGTPGANSSQEMFMHQMEQLVGIDMTHVPYGGGSEVNAALLGGHLEVACLCTTDVYSNLKDGLYKILAVSSEDTDPIVPDAPTFLSQGYDLTCTCYYSILAPAGVDEAVITILRDAYAETMASDYVADAFKSMGIPVSFLTAEETSEKMYKVTEEFKAIIDGLNNA